MMAIGSLCCAIPAGYLADRFGSRKCIIGVTIPMMIFSVIVAFSGDVYSLCVARVFSGFTTGGLSVAGPMYISEIAQVSLRGTLSSFFELLIYIGAILTVTLGARVDYVTLAIIIGVVTITNAVVFIFLPESPTYLVKVKRRTEAEKALRFYRNENYNVGEVLDRIDEAIIERAQLKSGDDSVVKHLMSKAVVRGLIASLGITIFQQFSGVDGVAFYSVQVFQTANSIIDAYTCAIIMTVIQLVASMAMMMVVEKAGRKTFIYISSIGISVCLALFALYFIFREYQIDFYGLSILPIASMFAYNAAFAFGLGPVPMILCGELFAPEIKGVANGISIATNWLSLFVVTKTMPVMILEWGAHYTFFFYSFCMVACVFFTKFFVPETKGKTLEEIQKELSS